MAIIEEIITVLKNILGVSTKKTRRKSSKKSGRKTKTLSYRKKKKMLGATLKVKKPSAKAAKKTVKKKSREKPLRLSTARKNVPRNKKKAQTRPARSDAGTIKTKQNNISAEKKAVAARNKTTDNKKSLPRNFAEKNKKSGVLIGEITHYFNKIMVGVVKMTNGQIRVDDMILIEGKTTSFRQKILSLQVESLDVRMAKKGQLVGLKVREPIKVGDKVYKVLNP